jgi:hypothetical protein
MLRLQTAALLCVLSGMIGGAPRAQAQVTAMGKLAGEKVAVVVFAQNETAERLCKNALSRLEGVLADNDITVLDREKAGELKDVFRTLDDPGAFVTAETFVENAGKFDIKGLAAIHLSADVRPGLADYFTATAHADVRFVSEQDAQVVSLTTTPMGAPGRPPSDGLTENSALINAVQRAVDDAAGKMGLEIMDPALPRSVQLELQGPTSPPAADWPRGKPEKDTSLGQFASLDDATWRKEEITCTAKAPGGALAAVAGYISDTDMHRRPPRLYGSRIHLVDLEMKREITALDCHPVEKKTSREKGTKKVLACTFLDNWRYLVAVTGNALFMWDTERGVLLSSLDFASPLKSAALGFVRGEEGLYVLIDARGKSRLAYRIVRKK